jgi:hypothetical protein
MRNRHEGDLKLMIVDKYGFCFSPVKFLNPAIFWKYVFGVKTSEEGWGKGILEAIERMLIKMIIMIVADKYPVDGRQAVDLAGRRPVSLRANPLKR